MIKEIIAKPLNRRTFVRNNNIIVEYEFLTQLEDGVECTVWIASDEVREFVNGKYNKDVA